MAIKVLSYQLFSCGREGPPRILRFNSSEYFLKRVIKHDFFAGTGLYEIDQSKSQVTGLPKKLILKIHRRANFLGFPLRWFGRLSAGREIANLRRLKAINNVPKLLGTYKDTGLVYEYIEGGTLDDGAQMPDDFFDNLIELLKSVHKENMVYLDMNKRGNIVVGADGKPYLIDFQISLYRERGFFAGKLERDFWADMQRADYYHILKHKRRLRPDLLKEGEEEFSREQGYLISYHRVIADPFRKIRRRILKYVYSWKITDIDKDANYSPENDPTRYL